MIMLSTPCGDRINTNFAQCREDTVSALRANGYSVYVTSPNGPLIFQNRNQAILEADIKKIEWLVFIDSDMEFGPDDVMKLIHSVHPIITGICKKSDGQVVLYNYKDSDNSIYPIINIPRKEFKVDIAGFGVMAIRKSGVELLCNAKTRNKMWEHTNVQDVKLNYPFNHVTLQNGVQTGEDTAFCLRLRELEIPIMVDPSIVIGHEKMHVVR